MVNQKLEEILWAEYKRITKGQQVQSLSDLPVTAGQNEPESRNEAQAAVADPFVTSEKAQAQSAPEAASAESSVWSKIGHGAADFGKSRLGAMPLISTLVGLFTGGGDPATPPPLVKYALPPSIHIAAANSHNGGSLQAFDYGQDGVAREYGNTASSDSSSLGAAAPVTRPAGGTNAAAPQIVVNVQAMDSRSFLDHSQEIAQAVREAMLNMHSLNDVVSEL